MAHVRIENLYKSYPNGVPVLRDVNLAVQDGEFLVLLGPSGCGKSTLLRLIAGLEDISSGSIFIGNRRVNDVAPGDRNISMVFQDYALYPHMSVRQNLAFGLKMRRTPRAEIASRVERVARQLGLEKLLGRKPAQLSGGQRQRVAIGRAIVREPDVFLFDEPLSNLDAQLRSQTRIELAALQKRLGATAIYVTHDQVEAMTLANRIAIINKGVIQQIGPPLEIYRHPANTFVASFLGSPGMNILSGAVVYEYGRLIFAMNGFSIDLSRASTPVAKSDRFMLGVRPEAIRLMRSSHARARVLVIEPHGHEVQIVVALGDQRLVVRARETSVEAGDSVAVAFDPANLHWFDPAGVSVDNRVDGPNLIMKEGENSI